MRSYDKTIWLCRLVICGMVLVGSGSVNRAAEPQGDEAARKLAREAIEVAGGAEHLPKVLRWKETYYVGDLGGNGTPREAIVAPPQNWFQQGADIAAGNDDRTEKTYLVWMWTLEPLLDEKSTLTSLPDSTLAERSIRGVRVSRETQKDIDLYFDAETKKLARIDWRIFQIDFDNWTEQKGFKYPAKAFVRKKSGGLHLRTEFEMLEILDELPEELKK